MEDFEKVPAILLLEDGTVYHGYAAGKIGTASGEMCFNTGMTGYQEIFTDPSYAGQLLVSTNVHIGNYATMQEETESEHVQISGLICRNFSATYSRKRADQSLQDYFIDHNLVAITNVDTRAVVRHIRDKGAMNGIISSETTDIDTLKSRLAEVPKMEGLELASTVSVKEPYHLGDENADYRVSVLDYGAKKNILRSLASRGCYLKVFPYNASFSEIMDFKPDGILLSNGPGDPSVMLNEIEVVKELMAQEVPIFGICLGHQILALANGLSTFKMHHGHRGSNHPVKNLLQGHCEVTSQNHGFSLDPESLKGKDIIEVTHINLNDDSVEGIRIVGKPFFSVQHHPEASPGPQDSAYLFDEFKAVMENSRVTS